MNMNSLNAEREHLANLLEAAQRCAHFLHASASKVAWPLDGVTLLQRQKDVELFESLAAFNERFAKLQDTLGAAMRHCALLMSEATSPFLKVGSAARLLQLSAASLSVEPASTNFEAEFRQVCSAVGT